MIFIIEDDEIMAECVANAVAPIPTKIFSNGVDAVAALDEQLPKLIFLDILLDGPDGFTFLNELASYSDTNKIPIVIISSLDFSGQDLASYGVVGILDKTKMVPKEIKSYAQRFA
ncbi:response regulator [Candidatus Saccharibacteria bacterium]|nr:response regulator [Candidatus Saccharibacteria bacterium]